MLLHKINDITKKKLLNSYIREGYKVLFENENIILITNNALIEDEETYIKITISIVKKSNMKGQVIDLTEAFNYAKTKGKYKLTENRFDWYVRNIITKIISEK